MSPTAKSTKAIPPIFSPSLPEGAARRQRDAGDKHLYDYVLFDSEEERRFADMLDKSGEVSVYVKLPKGFYITTPVGGTAPTGHRLS